MAKDLICGMNVDEKTAMESDYNGKAYYFCSGQCKKSFDGNPSKYVKA
ncbi:MAG TPA: YHS domain-containing protein [archaeon]|nr:YHS domain-containing protein [archaeon]